MSIQLPLKNGNIFSWGILDAAGLLQHYCRSSSTYRAMMMYAIHKYPGRKLHLVLYEDEIQPGNVFLGRRKMHAWYFSFREFDLHVRDEHAWICFALLQSAIAPKVKGEFSNVSKMLCKSLFTMKVPNFATGIAVELPEPHLVETELYDLQDAAALKAKWNMKGHGGVRPCLHCTTVFKKGHSAASVHPGFVDITDLNWSNVKDHQATDEEIWGAQDDLLNLKSTGGSAAQLKQLEVFSGQNCQEDGLLACKELRPYVKPSRSSYDPMHCYFSGGIADNEITLLMNILGKQKFDFRQIEAYVNFGWSPAVRLQFSIDGIKGMASDVLRAVPLLRHFLVKVVKPHGLLVDETASFEALADVVQQLQKLKLWANIPSNETDVLQRLQAQHYTAFKKAYGGQQCVPKHHYSMHIPRQLRILGLLLDAFVCERKHRLPKEVVQHYTQGKAIACMELHAVTRLNLLQLDDMDTASPTGELVGPSRQLQVGCDVGGSAKLQFGTIVKAGEVILADNRCFVLSACLRNAAGLQLFMKSYTFVGFDGHPAAKVWRDSGQFVAVSTHVSFICQATLLSVFLCFVDRGW